MRLLRCLIAPIIVFTSMACLLVQQTPEPRSAIMQQTPTDITVLAAIPSATPAPIPTATIPARPDITRVVIISIDGLRPDAIDLAPMPVLQALMQGGAYSLTAQTISPTTTLPAHASMLTGLCPSIHGVDWDQYFPERGIAQGTDLFDLAHAAGMRTVMVVGKEKLQQVTDASNLDVFQWVNDPDQVVGKRAAALLSEGFSVLFVHFPDDDLEGHAYGWLSVQQLLALRGTDAALQQMLDALQAVDMREQTLLIVTADHGGHNTSHGFDIPADATIPWVINGPGVQPMSLKQPINITDTAATAAWALGLPIPSEWSGMPVYEAFGLPEQANRRVPRCP